MPDLSDDSKGAIMKTESKPEKKVEKLKLKRETLRKLTDEQAKNIVGGRNKTITK